MKVCLFTKSYVMVLLVAMVLFGCTGIQQQDVTDRIFRGEAEFGKLKPAIQQSRFAVECPQPSFGQLQYVLYGFPDEEVAGMSAYAVVERVQGITGMAMSSSGHDPEGLPGMRERPSGSGRILSCGGFFTLAFREQRSREDNPFTHRSLELPGPAGPSTYDVKIPDRRYEVTQITAYNGGLFPLKVGNELAFSYTALLQSWASREGHALNTSHGHVQYTVLGVNDSFAVRGASIPGKVYLIERVQERASVGEIRKRDYYYSETLGWVVRTVDYDNGSPVSVIDLTGWNNHGPGPDAR